MSTLPSVNDPDTRTAEALELGPKEEHRRQQELRSKAVANMNILKLALLFSLLLVYGAYTEAGCHTWGKCKSASDCCGWLNICQLGRCCVLIVDQCQ